MERLTRAVALMVVLGLAACATPPPAPPLVPPPVPIPPPRAQREPPPAPVADLARLLTSPRGPVRETVVPSVWPVLSALNLDEWPFGWVVDRESSQSLGLSERFWSEQKLRWNLVLDASTPTSKVVQQLELIHRFGSPEEAHRAAWSLYRVYTQAELRDPARTWLDRAHELHPSAVTGLERAWDQAFRLQDLAGARGLWRPTEAPLAEDRVTKARLLRRKLYGGVLSLASVGADDFLSSAALDRDDLWGATWNGAVVRWSLATDQLDLILPSDTLVAPIKLLVTTGWFVYAFQDQALLRYSKVTGTWRSFSYPPGWVGLRVQAAVAEGEETLWVAHLGQGLWRWSQGQWSLIDEAGGGPFLNALASDGQGGFLVGTKDRGLWRWIEGNWSRIVPEQGVSPTNVSVIQPNQVGDQWLVGTWGEGTWLLSQGVLSRWSSEPDYVTAAAWAAGAPLWGSLDQGIVQGRGESRTVLGPREGLASASISGLVTWEGRWIWGTMGQGWEWWSEHENSAILR